MIKKDKLTDVFFDLDHTLWDFEMNSAATFNHILAPYGFHFTVEDFMEVYSPINHAYWKQYRENVISTEVLRFKRLEDTFIQLGYPQSSLVINQISDDYITNLSTYTYLFKGTIDLLTELKQRYRLHIITNGFEGVQQKKISNAGLGSFFEVVLTAEKAGIKKPSPIIYNKALDLACTKAENALMIGDSFEADIEGALTVGMQAIHFNSHQEPYHTHCPIVNELTEIRQYL